MSAKRDPEAGILGAQKITCGAGSTPHPTADLAARAARHDYALRVVSERADGILVTQFYTNLPAAERKVTRTRGRGLNADLSLVRITPVPWATLADIGGGDR